MTELSGVKTGAEIVTAGFDAASGIVSKIIDRCYLPQERADDYLYNQSVKNGTLTSDDIDRAAAIYGAHKLKREYINMYKAKKKADTLIAGKVVNKDTRLNEDWFAIFVEHVSKISDESILNMWAAILAGEILETGSFRKVMLNRISMLDQESATAFTELCCRTFVLNNSDGDNFNIPFFIGNVELAEMRKYSKSRLSAEEEKQYLKGLPSEDELQILEEIGLIRLGEDFENTNIPIDENGTLLINVNGKSFEPFSIVDKEEEYYKKIYVGSVVLTKIGVQLYNVLKSVYITKDFILSVIRKYNKYIELSHRDV